MNPCKTCASKCEAFDPTDASACPSFTVPAAPVAQPVSEVISALEAVLCSPDGRCCIDGSDEDRAVVDRALSTLRLLSAPAAPVAPADLVEAVDRVLAEAPCECGERLRFDRGEHLSGCYLFDLNEARNRASAPAASVALLQEAAALFRFYEQSHRAKGPGHEEKVARNADIATRIEAHLKGTK